MDFKTLILILLVCSDGLRTCCALRHKHLKLELVQVLFRHGERTPQKDEIKLIGNMSIGLEQPWGFSQLTNRGKMQEYRIGTMLRERYDQFLGEYTPGKVYACSSAFDRTKMSLQLVLAGLYPPSEQFAWNEDLSWMPIPIHFVPYELDVLFNLDRCPTFRETWEKLMNSREMKNKLAAYEDIIKLLKKYHPSHIKFNFEQLFYMNSVLNIQQQLNVSMPEWYTPQRHAKITRAAKFHLDTLSYTQDLITLNGGGLARRLLENMDPSGKSANPRKIYLYSGHEFTLYALAKAHGVTLASSPFFGSAIIVEKLRDHQGDLYVKMYYWAGEDATLTPIVLPDCEEYCKMEDYLNLVKPSLPSDDEMLCLYKNLKPTDIEKILTTDAFSIPI